MRWAGTQGRTPAGRIARIAYMPQGLGRNLYPTLSVVENLDFFGRLFGQEETERKARIDELLARTGLDPYPERLAGKLSGGMKQKLSSAAPSSTILTCSSSTSRRPGSIRCRADSSGN